MTLLTEKAETEILKTDVLGRVWTPRDRREALVAKYESSSMTAAEFAKWSGVKYATFTGWVVKVRKARRQNKTEVGAPLAPEPMSWAEAVCEEPDPGREPAVVIHLGAGVRVEARDGRVAAELLGALGVRVC
jgi:transposase